MSALSPDQLLKALRDEQAGQEERLGEEDSAERARLALAARLEIERLHSLIDYHNHSCQSLCGFGELEGLRCQYRPYFPRRCPECPTDWIIER